MGSRGPTALNADGFRHSIRPDPLSLARDFAALRARRRLDTGLSRKTGDTVPFCGRFSAAFFHPTALSSRALGAPVLLRRAAAGSVAPEYTLAGLALAVFMREALEYAFVWVLLNGFAILPRPLAWRLGAGIGAAAWLAVPDLRRTGLRNLEMAFPEMPAAERERLLRRLYGHLGRQLAEFCRMPRYTRENTRGLIRYEGLEHYLAARARSQGVLIVTGHLGAWELSSFWHSLMGYPMTMVIRRLDNPRVDRLVNGIRCLHGNRVVHKDDFARGLLAAMRQGETVGILMDTNMTPPQGAFVPFFGTQACTASGLARVALRTGAAVLPGFLVWEAAEKRYVLRFGEEIALVRTEEDERDVIENTARFTAAIEDAIRRCPDQWLWVHRRWKTRPAGEPPIY